MQTISLSHVKLSTMIADIVELKVTSDGGKVERRIIAQESITVYNLHKVIQFSLFPSKSDDAIAATSYEFKYNNKPVKKAKTTKLHNAVEGGGGELEPGTTFTYKSPGGTYTVQVMDTASDDVNYYVPRCIGGHGGNIDLDKVNKKLIRRRFNASSNRLGFKQLPGFWCDRSTTTNKDIWGWCMSAMRAPLERSR